MFRHASKTALTIAASAVIFALIIWYVGFERSLKAVLSAGVPAFASTGILTFVMLLAQSLAWQMMNRPIGHKVRLGTLLAATIVGTAGNVIAPSHSLGGEPVKVIYVGRRTGYRYDQQAGVVLLCKYLEALSFLLFIGAATVLAAVGFRHVLFGGANLPLGIAILAVAAAAVGLCLLLWFSLSRRWTPLRRITGWLVGLGLWRKFFLRLREQAYGVEHLCSRLFNEEGWAVVPAFLLYVLAHATIFFKPMAFFGLGLGWQVHLQPSGLAVFFLATQILLSVQLTPSGVGTLDGGLFGVLALAGLSQAIGPDKLIAYLICLRIWDAALVAFGATLAGRVGAGLFGARPPLPAAGSPEAHAGERG
jgi:uncharacterized protein (TIRG00374 family)